MGEGKRRSGLHKTVLGMGKVGIIRQLFGFLWKQRMFWLIPIILVLILLIILVVIGENSVIAPFIYSLV